MTDDRFYALGRKPPPPRKPQSGEVLFEFVRESDHARLRCKLPTHEGWGVEAQLWINGELLIGRRFDIHAALAVQWAMVERDHIAKGHHK